MSIKEIRDFYAAKYTCDLADTIYIQPTRINEVLEKIAKLAQDYDWKPLKTDLLSLHKYLDEYRIHVCQKTNREIEDLRAIPLPETLKRQFDDLVENLTSPHVLSIKIAEMLKNPDFAPYHARLTILKMRVDEVPEKDRDIPSYEIGLAQHFVRITKPLFSNNTLVVCPKDIEKKIWAGHVNELQENINKLSLFIFSRMVTYPGLGRTPLNCCVGFNISNQLPMVQLLIRTGSDVNGGFSFADGPSSSLETPPLSDAFVRFWHYHSLSIEAHKKLLQFLINAGANPNLTTRPIYHDTGQLLNGCSVLLHHIISRTDNRADELLPILVDAGMNVNAFEVMSHSFLDIEISTPLMHAISLRNFARHGLNFIRALIFNNAIVHEAARKLAEKKGCLEDLNKCVQIRESVLNDLMAPVGGYLPREVAQVVSSYWTPYVPEMRARCYAIMPIPDEPPLQPDKHDDPFRAYNDASTVAKHNSYCTIC